MAMPGHDTGGPLRRLALQTDGEDGTPTAPAELRIVEAVGRRLIVGCGCGYFFFTGPGVAICDHCGAEGDTDLLAHDGEAETR